MWSLFVDQPLLAVLKAMAKGEIAWVEGSDCYCFYCSWYAFDYSTSETTPEPVHDPDCPVTIARRLLQMMELTMKLYRLDYQWLGRKYAGNAIYKDQWIRHHSYAYGWSEEEVLADRKALLEKHKDWPRQRNHRVSLVREVKA